MTRIRSERIIRIYVLSRIVTDFPERVMERIGADFRSIEENVTNFHGPDIRLLKTHGFLRSAHVIHKTIFLRSNRAPADILTERGGFFQLDPERSGCKLTIETFTDFRVA
ncbi:unnamed protein product, partial [Hapterophycus canaliculatus]